jgi:type I restriction enzyme, S subunit
MEDFKLCINVNPNKIFILKTSELEKRLDPFYYIPEIKELEKKVKEKDVKPLRYFIKNISSGATPKTEEVEKYYSDKENGIPFLRVQNLSPTGILEYDDCKYINKETHENYLKRSQVQGGDLLIKITGVGRMAVASVAPDNFVGNTNQHIAVIKTGNKEVSTILASYLNSDIGEKLASRRATGGTRPALDYPALLSIPIMYDERILEITKNAVAEKNIKQNQAKELLASIDTYLLNELGIMLPEKDNALENRIFTTSVSQVSGGRFDPKLYDNYTSSLRLSIKENNFKSDNLRLKDLLIQSFAGSWGEDELKYSEDEYFKKCLVIRATEFDNKYNLNVDNSRVKFRLIPRKKLQNLDIQTNDLLIEKSGGSPDQPVGRISILTDEIVNSYSLCYSNFIHKIRINTEICNPIYLFNFLKTVHNIKLTDAMQSQTNGIRNLIMSNYFNQIIPLPPPENQTEIAHQITTIRNQAKQLELEADAIMKEAKAEVENIILGE